MNDIIEISEPNAFAYPPHSKIFNCFFDFGKHCEKFKWNIPKIQREVDIEHIEKLYKKIKLEYNETGVFNFGVFELASLRDVLYLLNGQHRYGVLLKLKKEKINNIFIHVRIKEVDTEDELNNYFRVVNDSKISVICNNSCEQIIINGIKKYLIKTYSNKYFPTTKKPQRPNIKLDSLVNKIIEMNIISKLNITSPEDLAQKINKINSFYHSKIFSSDFWIKQNIKKDAKQWIEKATDRNIRKPFLLGIYPNYEWLDRMLVHYQQNIEYENMVHYWKNIHVRKKPSLKLKTDIWEKRNGKDTLSNGKCYVCEEHLNFKNMQCGHIVSYYDGGKTELSNLEPICGSCNQSMGTTNLNKYKSYRRIRLD
jgi:hypothetical protein